MIAELLLLAQEAIPPPAPAPAPQSTFDLITPFLNVGLVGVLLLMFVFRKGIVPEWVLRQTEERHKAELESRDADIKELKEMVRDGTELYNTQVVPAFTRSIDVNREYLELLRDRDRDRDDPRPRPRASKARE